MVVLLLTAARAASVVCDPVEARRILEDARVDEARAALTHPWLVPGLARGSASPAVAEAVGRLCARGGDLSVERADVWEDVGWAAYAVVLSDSELDGCVLQHHRVPLSIGIGPEGTKYALRGTLPDERTRLRDCGPTSAWRSERVVDGVGTPVRLVEVVDHDGDEVERVLYVRKASADGWSDQLLVDPAPPRLFDPTAAGPLVRLVPTRGGEVWIVMSQDRSVQPCVRRGGQVVWRWSDGTWVRSEGRTALALLTREGLWRYAGDDGWMLILAQDDEGDVELLEPRMRRLLSLGLGEELLRLESADFPNLNPGFWVIVPAPWPNERDARAARAAWDVPSSYVKRGWAAIDGCSGH